MEKLKEIWKKVWPFIWSTIKLLPSLLLKTALGRRIIALAIIALLSQLHIMVDQNEIIQLLEELAVLGVFSAVSWSAMQKGKEERSQIKGSVYTQLFYDWFEIKGTPTSAGILFTLNNKYFLARYSNYSWVIEGDTTFTISTKDKEKLNELCK